MAKIRLMAVQGNIAFPHGNGDSELLLVIYGSGDCDTISWPRTSGLDWDAKLYRALDHYIMTSNENTNLSLYDRVNTIEWFLPNGRKWTITSDIEAEANAQYIKEMKFWDDF